MRLFNISQILQERLPGYYRPKFHLNKFYFFLALISFGLSTFCFYIYFTTYSQTFQPFADNLDIEEVLSQQTADISDSIDDKNVLFPARDFFPEDYEFPENVNFSQPIFLGNIFIKANTEYTISLNFPQFVQSNSLYYKNKSADQFTEQSELDQSDEISKSKWRSLNKIKTFPVTIDNNIIYPAGLIADTLPFDRVIFIDENGAILQTETEEKNKIDGKKVVIQEDIDDLVLPLSWNIQNTASETRPQDIPEDELIFSNDRQSFLPKSFIRNSRLLDWVSIGSFPGYNLPIGRLRTEQEGNFKVFLLDYDINQNYLEMDVLRNRKFNIKQNRTINVNSLALPVFLIINGLIMTFLAIYI